MLAQNPRSFVANYRSAVANFHKGNLDAAIAGFHTALEINPDHKRARENLRSLEDMRMRFS